MSASFNPPTIFIEKPPLTIFEVLRKIEREHIELNPDFQRNFVWDEQRQSRLIESVLLKIPLPTFYLDATDGARWQVVDGLQRLSTLQAFCKTQTLQLSGLEFLTDLNGARFEQLSSTMQRTIEDTPLTLITVQPGTPRDVKFMIFQRINTSGINLNNQEIRHAIFGNPARDFLRDLAESEAFRVATNGLVDPRRMDDRECVLRFMTFRLNPYDSALESGNKTLTFEELLNQTVDDLNTSTPIMRDQYAEEFRDSMGKAHRLFEDLAFRQIQEQLETGSFRKALFEVWSVLLNNYEDKLLQQKQTKQAILTDAIALMTNNAAFLAAIQPGADDRQSILTRFSTVDTLLRKLLT